MAATASGVPRTGLKVALALALGPALALGFGRFAYGLLVPAMQADLGWTNAEAGLANSANAFGYLLGAVGAARLVRAIGDRAAFVWGVVLATVTTSATGFVSDYGAILLLRFLPGLSGAAVFVAGGLLAVRLGAARGGRPSLVLGLFYVGVGFGISLTGCTLPFLVAADAADWRAGWYATGALCLLAALPATWGALQLPASTRSAGAATAFAWRRYLPMATGYFLFAVGMIGYMTFMVAYLVANGAGPAMVAVFWVAIGVAAMPSAFLWAPALDRTSGGGLQAVLIAILTAAAALPLLVVSPLAAVASSAMFGSAVFSVVAATTSLVRRATPPAAWPAGIGFFTTIFGTGQTIGPYLAGAVSDLFGGLEAGLAMAAALLAAGAVTSALQPPVLPHG